jgi:hypothetical protein
MSRRDDDDAEWARKRNRGLMLAVLIALALAGGVYLTVRITKSINLGAVGEHYKQAEEP